MASVRDAIMLLRMNLTMCEQGVSPVRLLVKDAIKHKAFSARIVLDIFK